MKSKRSFLLVFMLCVSFIVFSQKITNKKLQFIPYVGLSSPQGDFKNVSGNGSVIGFSLDKYLSSKLALGIDLNYQTSPFLNGFDYSIIPSPSVVTNTEQGSWTNTTITFGPTYSFGSKKLITEIYTKAGVSLVKSPSANATFLHPAFPNFDLFDLREQKVTSFGITSGIRFNYNINEKFTVFINPQYVISGAEINYFYKDPTIGYIAPNPDLGVDGYFDPGLVTESPGVDGVIKPSHFNLNAGIKISLGTPKKNTKTSNINRNLPICDISLAEVQCDSSGSTLKLMKFWNNFDPFFTTTVEVFNGTTLINPNSSAPQSLSQNYGNIPFYTSINNNLIGVTLKAVIKIFDTNGVLKCESNKTFTVPPCSPPPPSCSFDLDINNVTCDTNFINYTSTSTWANIAVGSTIEFVASEFPSGTSIPLPVPPITVTSINITGNATNTVSIPYSYNGAQINITMKITDPTTGFVRNCGFADAFTPLCEPTSTICDWEYRATCDPINKGIKIDVTSSWSNASVGSTLRYKLINLNSGANIPFTFSPNNLPQNIVTNGSSTHTLFINSSFGGTQAVFKMEIVDANGVVLCNEGIDLKLPTCVFETCELVQLEARCNNEQPYMAFSVNWNNYSNFSNYSIYLEAKDENGNPVAWFNSQTFPPYQLTGTSGSVPFNMNLFTQYAGTTITIFSKICETGTNKDCCLSVLKIDIPKCCVVCSDITLDDTTNMNQNNSQIFRITGDINRNNPSSSPVTKIVAQLESISFNSQSISGLPITNLEFVGALFTNGNGNFRPTLKGSLLGSRSNLFEMDFTSPTVTHTWFILDISNNSNKIIQNYRVKLTFFKADGTYCEKYLEN